MKLQFKNQKFQSDAAKAVTDVFIGQKNAELLEYTQDLGCDNQAALFDVVGFRNSPLNIDSIQLTENVRKVQMPAQLKPSDHVAPRDLRLTIEMETGTGKTLGKLSKNQHHSVRREIRRFFQCQIQES